MLERQPELFYGTNHPLSATAPNTADADALVAQAETTALSDGGIAAATLLTEALAKTPDHHAAQLLLNQLHHMFVPRWHFPMMADAARNRAYAEAINAKVQPGDIVLDIGAGAGLTAMLAARAGAGHVYAVEQQPMIAEAAQQVIADNNLSDKITILSKWSHDIIIGKDMPERADVVLSEIVDSNLLGEGALATLKHAMIHLAKPGARCIPESGILMAQPVQSDALTETMRPQSAEGFDLSSFHKFSRMAQITPNDAAALPLFPLGPAVPLFYFDFTNPDIAPARSEQTLTCDTEGTVHAVVVSFQMQLSPGILVSNDLRSDGHWGRTAYLPEVPMPVTAGTGLPVIAQHDATKLSLSFNCGGEDSGAHTTLTLQ